MRGPMHQTTPDEARADALTLLATLTDRQLQARWNFGPTTGAILRAVAADPERVRCEAHYLSADEKHPATSTVYVRPPRPFRISPGGRVSSTGRGTTSAPTRTGTSARDCCATSVTSSGSTISTDGSEDLLDNGKLAHVVDCLNDAFGAGGFPNVVSPGPADAGTRAHDVCGLSCC